MSTKPMLASPCNPDNIKLPCLASAKLDGIRVLVRNRTALSRSFKSIPNEHVQFLFGRSEYEGLDGELIVGPANAPDVYRVTNSGVMAKDGQPDVKFHVFDNFERIDLGFTERHKLLPASSGNIVKVPQHYVSDIETLLKLEEKYLSEGYEGLMLRSPDGRYKFGRSTEKEGYLLKLKRFVDSEAVVIGVDELMRNLNTATLDAFGRTERSSHMENLVPAGTMGALQMRDLVSDVEFGLGTGFTAKDRAQAWADHTNSEVNWEYREWDESDQVWVTRFATAKPSGEPLLGQVWKYKSFPIGVKDKPRMPVALGRRDRIDL